MSLLSSRHTCILSTHVFSSISPRTMKPLDSVRDREVKIVTERRFQRTFRRNPAEGTLVGKFLYQDSTPIRAERGNTVEEEGEAGRKTVGGGGPHLKLQIAILPWPWFRFCKVMLWRKVSGIYQESWYNFATTIDAMKRLAPPHLPPLFSARSLTPFSAISLTRRYSSLSTWPPIN